MAKKKKRQQKKQIQVKDTRSLWQNLKVSWHKLEVWQQRIIEVLPIILTLVIIYNPYLHKGLTPSGVDVIGRLGGMHQVQEWQKQTGEKAMWNPYVFSGMPKYHRTLSDVELKLFQPTAWNSFFYFALGAIGMFLLLRFWGVPLWGAYLGSAAFVLSPHYQVLFQAGHFQKIRSILWIPWCVWAFCALLRHRNILSFLFFVFALTFQFITRHYQVVFYTGMILFFVGIVELFHLLRSKQFKTIFSITAILLSSIAFIIGMSLSTTLAPIQKYTPLSIRGGGGERAEGLDYDYATSWSFAPTEMISLLIPNAFGGSSGIEYKGRDVPELRGRMIPGYWGSMPFTDGGEYAGIIVLFLAIFGAVTGFKQKNRTAIVLSLFCLFALFLSFGRHFPLLYNLFFNFVPYFDKFRIPIMVLDIFYFAVICLAAFGFKALYEAVPEDRKRLLKILFVAAGIFILTSLVPFLLKGLFSFVKQGEANRYASGVLNLIRRARYDLMKRDALRLLLFTLLTGSALWLYLTKKIGKTIMSIALTIFLLLDLVSMYNRFFKKLDSIERIELTVFAPTNTTKFLQNDKSIFRVFPYEADIFTSNYWSYFFQSVGGYNPAKLRIYQDVIESGAGGDSPLPLSWNVINMLNSKYVISKQKMTFDNLQLVNVDRTAEYNTYFNRDRLPRAFFVGSYIVIAEKEERLKRLNDPLFDPGITAILEKNLPAEIAQPDSFLAEVTDFTPNHLELDVFTDKNALLVLSEIYDPTGWTAYIDDRDTEIYKTNHILRSLYVPKGDHRIRLVYAPRSFVFSIISKITIFIYSSIMLIYFFCMVKRRRKE